MPIGRQATSTGGAVRDLFFGIAYGCRYQVAAPHSSRPTSDRANPSDRLGASPSCSPFLVVERAHEALNRFPISVPSARARYCHMRSVGHLPLRECCSFL